MCGIFGYTGAKPATPILLDGIARLEYRGYDSAGIALVSDGQAISVHKSEGKLSELRKFVEQTPPDGVVGIGHTRWATHGRPSDENAHPFTDPDGQVAVVHNGIVENFLDLRRELESAGFVFSSQTDSECIPFMISRYLREEYSLEEAAALTATRLRGTNAVVIASNREPSKLVAFRVGNAGGIVIGYGNDEMLLASDLPALLDHTRKVVYLADGELVSITPEGASYQLLDATTVEKQPVAVPYDAVSVAKGDYKHFMHKEIHEQPEGRPRHDSRPRLLQQGDRQPGRDRLDRRGNCRDRPGRLHWHGHQPPLRDGRAAVDGVIGPHPQRGGQLL